MFLLLQEYRALFYRDDSLTFGGLALTSRTDNGFRLVLLYLCRGSLGARLLMFETLGHAASYDLSFRKRSVPADRRMGGDGICLVARVTSTGAAVLPGEAAG